MLINILVTILMGALTGYIAGIIMKRQGSWLRNIIIGIIGGTISGLIFGSTTLIGGLILSVACTCLVIWVWEKYIKKQTLTYERTKEETIRVSQRSPFVLYYGWVKDRIYDSIYYFFCDSWNIVFTCNHASGYTKTNDRI